MSKSELAWRTLHDVGLATWFGGSVFGSVALPREPSQLPSELHLAAAEKKKDPDPASNALSAVEAATWMRWQPVLAGSVVAHLVGGAGLLAWNWQRHKHQNGVAATTVVKTAVTAAAIGLTIGAAIDGMKSERLREQAENGDDGAELRASRERIAKRMRVVGPLIPATTGALLVLGAMESEEQQPRAVVQGFVNNLIDTAKDALPGAA
ncbi:MAG TPA: hypothetical protein VFL59_04265 [Candidatus Nanopelagicales bacterium]|nr:hypothetical protein [Candidatus Nanopelagicales bacterium]